MTEAYFFVAGAVFAFFAIGMAVVGVLAFQNEMTDGQNGISTGQR